MFQTLIVQPLYNLLVAIYGLLPGHDLGISIILFTLVIRLAMWPLLKKQLHQSKKMRDLQPELKKVKKAAGGDKQKEAALMMELYKEKGVSPFGSIGLTLIQIPLFLGVFQAARHLTEQLGDISNFTYPIVQKIPHVTQVMEDNQAFSYISLGFIDLSRKAFSGGAIYWPLLLIAVIATVLAYFQSKQILPQQKEKKRLRDILKASSQGKQPEQEDMTAAMGSTMLYLMPLLTLSFGLFTQGAMVMYLLATSAIGLFQQSLIFKKDTEELQEIAEVVSVKKQPVVNRESTEESKVTEKVNKKGKVKTTTRIITAGSSSQPQKSSKKKKNKRKRR